MPSLSPPALAIAALRSALFALVFYTFSPMFIALAALLSYFSRRAMTGVCMAWAHFHRLCVRFLLGQRIVVEGAVPQGAVLIACKHEAMFEAIDIVCIFDRAMIAAKKELVDIPIFGRAANIYGIVSVERGAGRKAIRTIQAAGLQAKAQQRAICLFPEGTRVPHGESPPVKAGFAALYAVLDMPVVPIAVDSGCLSPRGSFIKRSGTITYRLGEIIPPGLPRAEAELRVHAAINALNA